MENKIESPELEEMRQQMAELRQQLNEQLQLNEQQLHRNIISKTTGINNFGSWMLLGGIMTGILAPALLYYMYGFSLWCCIATSVLCILDSSSDYWSAHRIKSKDLSTKSISEITRTLISMKKYNQKAFLIGLFAIIPIFIWWASELLHTHLFDYIKDSEIIETVSYISIGGFAFGGLLGTALAIHLYRKQQRNIDNLIAMLNKN